MSTEKFAMEQQQQRASLMDMQVATHSTSVSSTAAADATSGLMSMLRKDIPQNDTDWQKGRNSLGARLPGCGRTEKRKNVEMRLVN